MKYLSLMLLVILFSSALVSCKKTVKQAEPAQQEIERVSGTHADVIAWEADDLK